MKVIFHLDLDSYFVSAERTINKKLLDKPVIVGNKNSKAIIVAASYDAKKIGIKVGMPLFKARKILPSLVVVNPNHNLYSTLSSKLFNYLAKQYTNEIEIASIDECYLDVTSLISKGITPKKLAKEIQLDVMNKFKLPLSIGISDNKFVAKMATQLNKPIGISLIKPGHFLDFFKDWDIQAFHGIGRSYAQKLKENGISVIKDLARADAKMLKPILGKLTEEYIDKANGYGTSEINKERNDLKNVGNSVTLFEKITDHEDYIVSVLSNLSFLVSSRMIRRNIVGKVISVKVGYNKKQGNKYPALSKQSSLDIPIQEYDQIFELSKKLFYKLWDGKPVRFLAVSVSVLTNMFTTSYQMNLFDKRKKLSNVDNIISKTNEKFQKKAIFSAKELSYQSIDKDANQTRFLEVKTNKKMKKK